MLHSCHCPQCGFLLILLVLPQTLPGHPQHGLRLWHFSLLLLLFSHSVMTDSSNPMDCSPQPPLSMEFSRQEYWSRLPFSSPGDLPDPGIEPVSPAWQMDPFLLSHQGSLDTPPRLPLSGLSLCRTPSSLFFLFSHPYLVTHMCGCFPHPVLPPTPFSAH